MSPFCDAFGSVRLAEPADLEGQGEAHGVEALLLAFTGDSAIDSLMAQGLGNLVFFVGLRDFSRRGFGSR